MKYRRPSVEKLLDAAEGEISAVRGSGDLAGHLTYLHAIVRELDYRVCRSQEEREEGEVGSVIERIMRKLEGCHD